MSSAGEVDAPTVQLPVKEVKAPEKPKPVKKKKPTQAKTTSHPPYFQMIKEALLALKEKGGSSPYAIAKYMEKNHKPVLPVNFKKMLGLQLKNQTARGKLVKIKASYKLSEAAKPKNEKKKATAKATKVTAKATKVNTKKENQQGPKRKRTVTEVAPKTKKSEAVKKTVKKTKTKKVSGPSKPKQPKSIKSPSKRARKATAVTA